jgi:hypothetical protein
MRVKYGHEWPDEATDLTIELAAFKRGLTEEQGGLGKFEHFWNVVNAIFNREGSTMPLDYNPWAVRQWKAACEHKYLAIAGCASSLKTESMVIYGLVTWMADPAHTSVILTSTSLKDSHMRVWGRLMKYWNSVPGLPGKPVESLGMIKYQDPETGKTESTAGLFLIAGDAKKAKDSVGKMIGFKNRTVIVIADELGELSPAILDAATGNLSAGAEHFQMIGMSNPDSYYDPFGLFSEPKDGWASISPDSSEWETNFGYCIRFDVEQSPNILAGEVIYPYMITPETYEAKKINPGENSPQFWRMYRGFWCPTGKASGLYQESDFVKNDASNRNVTWKGQPTRCAFLDPSFTDGGDRATVQLGLCGATTNGEKVLLLDKQCLELRVDMTIKEEPPNFQIARQYKKLCLENGVSITNAGADATGGGGPFCDILAVEWGTGFFRCQFGGAASMRPASAADPRPGREAYYDRVSEIWGTGVELIRTGQLKGLYLELIQELTKRLYENVKRATGPAIAVESKRKMRGRTGKSPDLADAAMGLVDLCRERLGLDSVQGESLTYGEEGATDWDRVVANSDRIYSESEQDTLNRVFGNAGFMPFSN